MGEDPEGDPGGAPARGKVDLPKISPRRCRRYPDAEGGLRQGVGGHASRVAGVLAHRQFPAGFSLAGARTRGQDVGRRIRCSGGLARCLRTATSRRGWTRPASPSRMRSKPRATARPPWGNPSVSRKARGGGSSGGTHSGSRAVSFLSPPPPPGGDPFGFPERFGFRQSGIWIAGL